ncbi:COG1361 S-layer family protein [Candidatus Nanohalovita haloferacivicina]|uniref:COG1361 S-layer family protein n=1 Tax=Candidatus Nanohalovita haloferacivicina TaxID=2978046 RepID=UPI00325FD919|nr:S-layer domain protein [Candidatus Nanohalobia archaeon BNXNv]
MKRLAIALTLVALFSGLASSQTQTASPPNQIELQVMSTEPSPLQIGQYADVRFKVTNERSDDFDNVTVLFRENYPFSVDPDNKKRWRIASLESGDSYQFRMQVRVDSNALQGEETMEFRVETANGARTFEIPVQVKADDDGLVISDVSFPEKVAPGTSRTMNLTIENTARAYFRNVEVSVNPDASTPVVTSGTSGKRIGSIESGETEEVSYTLNIDEGAENGVYRIPLELEYENEAGASLSKSETTGIVVGGSPQIEVGLNDDGAIPSGSTGTVTFRFINRGEGTAKFVKVEVLEGENYIIRTGSSVYLGDMNSDDYQTAESEIYTSPGTDTINIPVNVTYQENGEEKTLTETVTVDALTSEERNLYGSSSGSPILPVVIVILLLAGGLYYWRKRR